jgi:hypothetical protein
LGWIFWIEYAGFFGFGLYWLRLMILIQDANTCGRRMELLPTTESYVEPSEVSGRALTREKTAQAMQPWKDIP